MATVEGDNINNSKKENCLKRKHSEMGSLTSTENYEDEPPSKKMKQEETKNNENKDEIKEESNTNKTENNSNGNTSYGATKRQERKKERTGFTQKERNIHKRKQKQEKKRSENKAKFESMTQEEKTAYFDKKMEQRRLKQQQKQVYNEKLLKASKDGMKICIDLSFNKLYQKDMEYTNVMKQLCYCWNHNKLAKYSASLHLLNVDENWIKYFKKQGILGWKGINIHQNKDILDAFPDITNKDNFIYLTPDSDQILSKDEFMKNKDKNVYILGGIVDRIIVKELTLNRAKELGIKHCKLPLDELPDMSGRQCLNINAVFNMLLQFQNEDKLWIDVMNENMPNRNRNTSNSKKQRRRKKKKNNNNHQKDINNKNNNSDSTDCSKSLHSK